jgi:hypothetical protein
MVSNRSRRGNGGHAPGHIRQVFIDAIEAYRDWEPGTPEPTVSYDVRSPAQHPQEFFHIETREIPISQACGLVWNCADILPNSNFDTLFRHCGVEPIPERQTYASAARALKAAIPYT